MRYVPDGISIHFRVYLIDLNRYPPISKNCFHTYPRSNLLRGWKWMHIRHWITLKHIDAIMRYVPDGISIHFRLYLIDLNRYPPTQQQLFPYLPPFEFSEALCAYSPFRHPFSTSYWQIDAIMRYVLDGISIHLILRLIEINRYPPTQQ